MSQPPFLNEISLPSSVQTGEEFSITLSGNWPNPTWSHTDTQIDINTEENTVSISYFGKSSGGMAMQVLKPVSGMIKLSLPSSGTWTIEFAGRGQSISKTITVE